MYFIVIILLLANQMESDLSNSVKNGILFLEDPVEKVHIPLLWHPVKGTYTTSMTPCKRYIYHFYDTL